MKKCVVLLLIITILFPGCANTRSTSENIDDLEVNVTSTQDNEVTSDESIVTIDTLRKENSELSKNQEDKESEILLLNGTIKDLSNQINALNQKVEGLKMTNPKTVKSNSMVINVEDIKVGDIIDGYKVVLLENTTDHFLISFEGSFMLEGDFYVNPEAKLSFSGTEYEKDQIFSTKIKIHDSDWDLFNQFNIMNEETLIEELGVDVYNKMYNENLALHGIAIFKNYIYSIYWESESWPCAEFVIAVNLEVKDNK